MSARPWDSYDIGDEWVAFDTPYDAEWISQLKNTIPPRGRVWDKIERRWEIAPQYSAFVRNLCEHTFGPASDAAFFTPAAAPSRGPYADLWLLPGAPLEVVKAAYRALTRIHHPDRGGSTADMQRINQAYTVLTVGGGSG